MEPVTPSHLLTAARVADGLVYAAGLAGVIAGGLLFRQEAWGYAIVAWALTFVAGAALRLAAWASRALAEILVRTSRIEDDLARLASDWPRRTSGPQSPSGPHSPPDRWGGHNAL